MVRDRPAVQACVGLTPGRLCTWQQCQAAAMALRPLHSSTPICLVPSQQALNGLISVLVFNIIYDLLLRWVGCSGSYIAAGPSVPGPHQSRYGPADLETCSSHANSRVSPLFWRFIRLPP